MPKVKIKKEPKPDKQKYKKVLMVHITEELYEDLKLLPFHYRTASISNAVRNLLEDKVIEIKKDQELDKKVYEETMVGVTKVE